MRLRDLRQQLGPAAVEIFAHLALEPRHLLPDITDEADIGGDRLRGRELGDEAAEADGAAAGEQQKQQQHAAEAERDSLEDAERDRADETLHHFDHPRFPRPRRRHSDAGEMTLASGRRPAMRPAAKRAAET